MKKSTVILPLMLAVSMQAASALDLIVKDSDGKPLSEAKAALLFKSGAYQTGKRSGDTLQFEPFTGTGRLLVAAPGHEALMQTITDGDKTMVTLKPSSIRSSLLLEGKTEIPGKGGDIKVTGKASSIYINSYGIGINSGSKPARQPFLIRLKSPVSAVDATGKPFKIYVLEATENLALIEYTP